MTDKCISPLRPRMIEDMTVRNFVPKTQSDYTAVRHVQVAEMRARTGLHADSTKSAMLIKPWNSGIISTFVSTRNARHY